MLRSSSIHEPSDPPFRVIYLLLCLKHVFAFVIVRRVAIRTTAMLYRASVLVFLVCFSGRRKIALSPVSQAGRAKARRGVMNTHTHVPTVTLALMYCFLAHTKIENAQDTFFPSKHTKHTSPAETIIPVTERTISAGHIVTRLKSAAIEGRIALNLASVMKRRPGTHRRVRETTFTIYTRPAKALRLRPRKICSHR